MPNLFIIDLEGTQITEIEQQILKHPEVGAVVLFTKNFEDKKQLKQLTASIRQVRDDIFIAVDHEGGEVQRFHRHDFFPAPAAQVYGDTYDLDPATGIQLAKRYGKKISRELFLCGVDLNFAPVLDLHDDKSAIIGQLARAFHADPHVVAILSEAFIEGMHEEGMPSVGKHFPGHGRCEGDSHIAYPVNCDSVLKLRRLDVKPFCDLIEKHRLDAVMAAHVLYPAVDSENPAGYSKRWLKDILRDELGFEGLVMSDCLSMKGADIGDMPTRAQRSVEAGCDMLILCNEKREELLAFLNAHHFKQSLASKQRIELFKQSMRRFNSVVSEQRAQVTAN